MPYRIWVNQKNKLFVKMMSYRPMLRKTISVMTNIITAVMIK